MEKTLLFFAFFLFIKGVFGEMYKRVNEGENVTLHTGLAEIQENDVMDWMYKAEVEAKSNLIARAEYNRKPTTYDALNVAFKGRLKLNGQTGDLTIINIKETDSGIYEVSNSIDTIRETFIVSVSSGQSSVSSVVSSGEIAGIIVGVVALVGAVVGVIFYKKKSQVL